MILLSSVTSLVRLTTSNGQAVHVHASWVDALGTVVTPGALNTQTASAATTAIVPAPAAATARSVEFVSVYNAGASPVDASVDHYDGALDVRLQQTATLAPGDSLFYEDARGWYRLAAGAEIFVST